MQISTDTLARVNSVDLSALIIDGASHATAFPTAALQGLDWIRGTKKR
jgi:hypothetical protein